MKNERRLKTGTVIAATKFEGRKQSETKERYVTTQKEKAA